MRFTAPISTDATTAAKIFFTSKPPTMLEVILSVIPLIINVNKPNVMILIGKVKITKIGLIIVFTIPKIDREGADQPSSKKLHSIHLHFYVILILYDNPIITTMFF